jgi:hypothetical protein
LDSYIIIGFGFNLVSAGCNYQPVVDDCCSNVSPPFSFPVAPPVELLVTPPPPPAIVGNTAYEIYAQAYSYLFTSWAESKCRQKQQKNKIGGDKISLISIATTQ